MKRRFHQYLLGLVILALIPVAILMSPLLAGLIAGGFRHGYGASEAFAHVVLTGEAFMPTFLLCLGAKLFLRLDAGYLPRIRKRLFWYYAGVAICLGTFYFPWVSRHESIQNPMPPAESLLACLGLFLVPLLIVLFTEPGHLSREDRKKLLADDDAFAA